MSGVFLQQYNHSIDFHEKFRKKEGEKRDLKKRGPGYKKGYKKEQKKYI